MNTLARISVILFLLLSAAPSVLHAAPAAAAPLTDTPALPAATQAAGATPTWWATVQADMARAAPGVDPAGLSPTPNWTAFGGQAGARMGRAASGAGDVNGDGFDDLLVGAEWYDNGEVDEGRVYLFYGSATGLSSQAAWTAESNVAGAWFGACATTAGDVNGDGFADVIISSPYLTNGQSAEGRIYLYLGGSAGLGADPAWTWESDQTDAHLTCTGAGGDVNGDGYSDVLAVAPGYDSGDVDEGKVFLFYGSPSGLDDTPGWTAESDQPGALFGYGGTAGDVNGDGFGDLIIGAQRYDNGQSDEGRAFVYLGSANGLATTAAWTVESDQDGAELGLSVSTAGDVNGDGFSDVVVGARYYDHGENDEGAALVYLGSANGLATTYAWMGEGDQDSATFGMFSTTAGDVNGDGYADLLIAAPTYDAGEESEGRAYVYYGSASGVQETPVWTAEGNQVWALFGYSFPGHAGDVNGDGYADIAVGALRYDSSQTDEGAAFVYHGSAAGLDASPAWTAESNQTGAWFGYTVGTAGDVNGDGYHDVIVGAYHYDGALTDEGAAFVYYGSATGLATSPAWMVTGEQASAYFGRAVGTAGDVNGDGYSDVIIGAYLYDHGHTDEGRAYVYYGSAAGLAASPAWTAESDQDEAWFGFSVATAGDVNGDGFGDVMVAAVYYDDDQLNEGRVYVFQGSATGLAANPAWTVDGDQVTPVFGGTLGTAGDVNGDGYSDVIVGAPYYDHGQVNEGRAFVYHGSATGLAPTPAWTAESNQDEALFGYVGTAGDVNGDGFSDAIVAAVYYDGGQQNEGRVYVYYGSKTGLAFNPAWTAEGEQEGAGFGSAVGTAGDVNGDGFSDVIIGAYYYDNGQWDEGRAFVYRGSTTGLGTDPAWTGESNQTSASFGDAVGTAGDVNGDGFSDVIVGARAYDNGEQDEGAAYVYHGNQGGLSLRPQQRQSDQRAPIALLGQADRSDRFQLALLGHTPFGRGKVRLEWEVKPRGVLFDGTGVQRSAAWLDNGTAGAQLSELVTGLDANTLYHWRVRLRYHPATTPFQAYSRWLANPWNGWNEARLRTAPAVPVAVTVASLDAVTASDTGRPARVLGLVLVLSVIAGFALANRPIKIRRQH